jgi:hypothetical protein
MRREFGLIFIILVALFLRLWISDFGPMILDFDPFYHARIAGEIEDTHFIPTWDEKELGGVQHYYPPAYHIWITLLRFISGADPVLLGSLFTVYLGVICVVFVYVIGREIGPWVGLGAAALFATTPILVFRSGLWARPTGLTLFLTMVLIYSCLRLYRRQDAKNFALAGIFTIAYVFSHSTVMVGMTLILISALLTKSRGYIRASSALTLLALAAGFLYYYKFIPHLNFSLGYTTEYLPLFSSEIKLGFWHLFERFLFLSTFNLTLFPFIIHGSYVLRKKSPVIAALAILSFLLVIKGNMYMLFIFTANIAVAASLHELSKKIHKKKNINYGWSLAIIIFLGIFCFNLALNHEVQGKKVNPYVVPLQEVLTAPLGKSDLIIANDMNVGHEIPYYSNAGAFISVLSDTKKWSKNYKTYKDLYDMTGDEALDTLSKNRITHILHIKEPDKEIFPFIEELELETISSTGNENTNMTLYKIIK